MSVSKGKGMGTRRQFCSDTSRLLLSAVSNCCALIAATSHSTAVGHGNMTCNHLSDMHLLSILCKLAMMVYPLRTNTCHLSLFKTSTRVPKVSQRHIVSAVWSSDPDQMLNCNAQMSFARIGPVQQPFAQRGHFGAVHNCGEAKRRFWLQ